MLVKYLNTPGKSELTVFCIILATGPLNMEPSILTIPTKHEHNPTKDTANNIKPITQSDHKTFLNIKKPSLNKDVKRF